ncbi:helix-turn-helix domain-containing protein [Cetobacterium sp. 2G large]|uniref:helix-turn-helix domain-containing protein n=1 Tax=Cetobacterium sp. 2G large TaxID=2759680 RepID=UPI00163BB90C|nr:helix-turn-helix domain-containing protein [Cetobacterium sp. 2G large]MBC2854127.1 helix-turn-helix domain-containing protein [Cetobacterium sp. 2G large]
MYINSKHLQILKFIKSNQISSLKDISDIFLLSTQHTKIHLEDIYCELFLEPSGNLKIEQLIEKIRNFPNSRNILRNSQQFTKNQKIFYLVFRLVKDRQIKLSHICEDLELTKRNLNNYFNEVSKLITPYHLKIKITNKGISLLGSPYSINKFVYLLTFKFLIEKDFLPKQLRKELTDFIKIKNFYKVRKDISEFILLLDCPFSNHSEISLLCFYICLKASNHEKKIEDIPIKDALKYKPSYYNTDFFYKIFIFLKSSSFKDISSTCLSGILDLIDIFKYFRSHFNKSIHNKAEEVRPIFAKYLGNHVYTDPNFFHIINPWINYSYLKELFHVDDYSFLNLNLNYFANSNIDEMTKEINLFIPKFTLFESIFVWYSLSKVETEKNRNIFVFKYLPKSIIPTLVEEIYKKHNIKIYESVDIKDFNNYKKNNIINSVITIENIKIYDNNIPVKNLFFPIPNYKRITPT